MRELLRRLGNPERGLRAIHVVGTNGKTTTTRAAEALLLAEDIRPGVYTSPHVVSWAERVRVGGEDADLDAVARARARGGGGGRGDPVRGADRGRVRRVRGRRGGRRGRRGRPGRAARRDQRPRRPRRRPHERRPRAHGRPRRHARGDRGREARGRPAPARSSCSASRSGSRPRAMPGPAASPSSPGRTARSRTRRSSRSSAAPSTRRRSRDVVVPGRLERVGEAPLEIWDGAHNLAGAGYLLTRVPRADWVVVASILRRQGRRRDARGALGARRAARGDVVVEPARASRRASSPRSGGRSSGTSRPSRSPAAALARGRELAGEDGALLVTGSLYLLADLASVRPSCLPWQASASG